MFFVFFRSPGADEGLCIHMGHETFCAPDPDGDGAATGGESTQKHKMDQEGGHGVYFRLNVYFILPIEVEDMLLLLFSFK